MHATRRQTRNSPDYIYTHQRKNQSVMWNFFPCSASFQIWNTSKLFDDTDHAALSLDWNLKNSVNFQFLETLLNQLCSIHPTGLWSFPHLYRFLRISCTHFEIRFERFFFYFIRYCNFEMLFISHVRPYRKVHNKIKQPKTNNTYFDIRVSFSCHV